MERDLSVGEQTVYYGYPIEKTDEGEYEIGMAADSLEEAKVMIKRCLEAGIIDWPIIAAGRKKKED